MKSVNKIFRGNASQFFVAGELCRRGINAVVTLGNCPNTDILASNENGTKFVHIQVKTFRPGDRTCSIGLKSEINYGNNFFWVLGGIPTENSDKQFVYYIIPSPIMSKNIQKSFQEWVKMPGKRVEKHNPENTIRTIELPPRKNNLQWDINKFENNWQLIIEKLK
ncbi:MAG: hypothetical protein KKH98_00370 [Spirochaetes bacterium]|nr:hypothetical protein [Spirochaetota bacterium]